MRMQREVYLFIDSISSKNTRDQYEYHLKSFEKCLGTKRESLLDISPAVVTQKIIQYLVSMRDKELSFGYRGIATSAIKHYYDMNDIVLNWRKIRRFLGEVTSANNLRGYTHEEISKLLDVADVKYRAIILMYASTGMRREALTVLRLEDMEYIKEYQLYKVRVYRKTQHEHITFTTPEAAKAINFFLQNKELRRRNSKEDFYFHNVNPDSITERLRFLSVESGLNHPATEQMQHDKTHRHQIPSVHGFRKFAITQMARAKVDVEIAKAGKVICNGRPILEDVFIRYDFRSVFHCNAENNAHYLFTSWSGVLAPISNHNSTTITVNASRYGDLTANFPQEPAGLIIPPELLYGVILGPVVGAIVSWLLGFFRSPRPRT